MRVLLSTIGSRGDVQPLVALATSLRQLGQDVHLCVPPDFRNWIESLGMPVTPIGPEVRRTGAASRPATYEPPSPEQQRLAMAAWIASQFEAVTAAAAGCDVIVAATALQVAARSVAEALAIPYVFAAYCPIVLPSAHHAPPPMPQPADRGSAPTSSDNTELWTRDAERFNVMFGGALNAHRTSMGLAPVADVRGHMFTDRPWLAADPTLAPWPAPADDQVFQPGAWILQDERPLSPELEAFLDSGEPPVFFGFGSTPAPQGSSAAMIHAARALGRRAVVSAGWADLTPVDHEGDCLAVGEVNLQALFKRVAAVVHHGGAGTTTLAALAGVPQVVVPQVYDQHYWAARVRDLGIGAAHAFGIPTTESLTAALEQVLDSAVAGRARSVATSVRDDGARAAARRLVNHLRG